MPDTMTMLPQIILLVYCGMFENCIVDADRANTFRLDVPIRNCPEVHDESLRVFIGSTFITKVFPVNLQWSFIAFILQLSVQPCQDCLLVAIFECPPIGFPPFRWCPIHFECIAIILPSVTTMLPKQSVNWRLHRRWSDVRLHYVNCWLRHGCGLFKQALRACGLEA